MSVSRSETRIWRALVSLDLSVRQRLPGGSDERVRCSRVESYLYIVLLGWAKDNTWATLHKRTSYNIGVG